MLRNIGTKKNLICYMVCCVIACLLLVACIIMGIISLYYPHWDEHLYLGDTPRTSDVTFNRSRGIFLECFDSTTAAERLLINKAFVAAHRDSCVHIPLWTDDRMNKLQGSVINTRRSHIAMVILALACALVALIIFISGAVKICIGERRSGYGCFSSRRPWFSLAVVCGIICLIGSFVFLFSYVLYHIFKGNEFEPYTSPSSLLPRVYSDILVNYNGTSSNFTTRYWGSMYYLCWGSLICLLVATLFFFCGLCGICCCNIFNKKQARVDPYTAPIITYDPTKDASYVHRDFNTSDFVNYNGLQPQTYADSNMLIPSKDIYY